MRIFFFGEHFFDIYLISWGSLQHSTLDERFTPRLVQKDSKGGSFRKMLPVESWKRRFAPLPVLKILCLQCMQCMRFFTCALQALGWDMEWSKNIWLKVGHRYQIGCDSTMNDLVENDKALMESLVSRGTGDWNKYVPNGVAFIDVTCCMAVSWNRVVLNHPS